MKLPHPQGRPLKNSTTDIPTITVLRFGHLSCQSQAGDRLMNIDATRRFYCIWFLLPSLFLEDVELVKNQEEGVLAKGVSVESSVTAKEQKAPKDILGSAVHVALQSPEPVRRTFSQKAPSENPFLVPKLGEWEVCCSSPKWLLE